MFGSREKEIGGEFPGANFPRRRFGKSYRAKGVLGMYWIVPWCKRSKDKSKRPGKAFRLHGSFSSFEEGATHAFQRLETDSWTQFVPSFFVGEYQNSVGDYQNLISKSDSWPCSNAKYKRLQKCKSGLRFRLHPSS